MTFAEFCTRATRCAKRAVEIVSSVCERSALMVATMDVRQLPPKLSLSTEVISELR